MCVLYLNLTVLYVCMLCMSALKPDILVCVSVSVCVNVDTCAIICHSNYYNVY